MCLKSKFNSSVRGIYILMALVLILGGSFFGLMFAKSQYLPTLLLGAGIGTLFLVFMIKPSNFFVFLFSIGVPFSYSYSLFTRDDLVWPRIIRDAIILLFLANLFLRAIHWKNSSLWNQRKILPFLLFLIYTLVLGMFSLDLPLATLWVGLKYYIVLPVLGLLVPVALRDENTLRSNFELFFSVAIIIAIIGIVESLSNNPFISRYARGSLFGMSISRALSVWGNPLSLAGYLGITLAFWHPLRKLMPERLQGWKGHFVTFTLWFCLLLTLSRSSLIAIIASFGLAAILLSRKRSNLIGGLLLLLSLVPLANLITWFRSPSNVGAGFLGIIPQNLRFKTWAEILRQFITLPLPNILLGSGLGSNSGAIHLDNFQAFGAELIQTNNLTTDNFYLTALFEMGLVGLIILGFVAIASIRICKVLYWNSENEWAKKFYRGILVGLIFFLARNFFLQGMRTFLAGFYFWVLIGLMVAVNNMDQATETDSVQTA